MAHSKILNIRKAGEEEDPQAAQLAALSVTLGLEIGGSLASIAYFVARATKQGAIGQADLNQDQNGFIANVFLPVTGMLPLKTSIEPGPESFRNWDFHTTEDQRVISIPSEKGEHRIELVWNRNESSTVPTVEIDLVAKVNRITIPHLDYDFMQKGSKPMHVMWRHYILQVVHGTSYFPHRENAHRAAVAEPLEQPSMLQESATSAGVAAISMGLPKFLAVMPPNVGARQVITDLTYYAATDPASRYQGKNLHIVLTRRNDNLEAIAERFRSHPRRDQVCVFTGRTVQQLGLGGVLERVEALDNEEAAGEPGKSAILLINTTMLREALKSELNKLTEGEFDLFRETYDTLEDQTYTPLTMDAHITELARQANIDLSTDEVRLFETLSNRLRSISFYDADHIGAPILYPFLKALSAGDKTISIGTSNIPVHHQRNIFADVYDNMLYMGFTDSPSRFFGLAANRMLAGDPIVHQLALGIQEGLYPRLRRAYVLTEDELVPASIRANNVNLFVANSTGTMVLNRENPAVYHHVFSRIAPLILQHEHGIINCSSRDEALAVTGYLNQLFRELELHDRTPARLFGFDIHGRNQKEQAESETSRLAFKRGELNFLVRVERDDGVPLRACSCLIDLTRNFSTKRFEQRFSHMLAPERNKYGVDVLFLSDKNEARFAQALDLFIGIKNGYFTPEHVQFTEPKSVVGFPSLLPEFERLFTDDSAYKQHVLRMEEKMTEAQAEFWTSHVQAETQLLIEQAKALIETLRSSPYESKHLVLSRPEANRLNKIFHERGELIYRELDSASKSFVDEYGILRNVREQIFEEGRPLVVVVEVSGFKTLTKDIGMRQPDGHPRFVPGSDQQRTVAALITEHVRRFNELPVARSVLGHKLAMALNGGDTFLAMLPGEIGHRIQDEGVKSRAEVFKDFMETIAAKLKRNEVQILQGEISTRLRQELIDIRMQSGRVKTESGYYPGQRTEDFDSVMEQAGVSKDVQEIAIKLMESSSPEMLVTARALDDFVRQYHCLPVTIGETAAPALWDTIQDATAEEELLPLLKNRDAKSLMASYYAQRRSGAIPGKVHERRQKVYGEVEALIRVAAESRSIPIPETECWQRFIAKEEEFKSEVMSILVEFWYSQSEYLAGLANDVLAAWNNHVASQRRPEAQ